MSSIFTEPRLRWLLRTSLAVSVFAIWLDITVADLAATRTHSCVPLVFPAVCATVAGVVPLLAYLVANRSFGWLVVFDGVVVCDLFLLILPCAVLFLGWVARMR